MLEAISGLPDGVIGVSAKGTVTKGDYDDALLPLLDAARREGHRVRFLYELGPELDTFTAGAAWEDARLGWQYLRLFERCAILTDRDWIRDATRLVGPMMPCPVRVFRISERQEGVAWLTSAPVAGVVPQRLLADKGVLLIEPRGPLRREDFDALALVVDPWIDGHGALRGIVVHSKTFPGWENFGSLLRHLTFVRDHHRDVRRIALAADAVVAEWAPRLAEHFVRAEVRAFSFEQLDEALAWAAAEPGREKGDEAA